MPKLPESTIKRALASVRRAWNTNRLYAAFRYTLAFNQWVKNARSFATDHPDAELVEGAD